MILGNREYYLILLNSTSQNREKSNRNHFNYRSNLLHKKAILNNFVVQCKTAKRLLIYCQTFWFIAGLNHKLNQSINKLQKSLIISDYHAINIKVWGACGRWFESNHPDW